MTLLLLVQWRVRLTNGTVRLDREPLWCSGKITRLPTRRTGFDSQPFVRGNRCHWSVGFLGDIPLSPPMHFGAAPYSPLFALIGSQYLHFILLNEEPSSKQTSGPRASITPALQPAPSSGSGYMGRSHPGKPSSHWHFPRSSDRKQPKIWLGILGACARCQIADCGGQIRLPPYPRAQGTMLEHIKQCDLIAILKCKSFARKHSLDHKMEMFAHEVGTVIYKAGTIATLDSILPETPKALPEDRLLRGPPVRSPGSTPAATAIERASPLSPTRLG
ncbi:hypothetical protein PR048_015026 [Dryococelus australis]|uniref:Uncharacterized protein n=1 Tax=Dryococelus australis TaxID=614101 RepID=A0ABQ9HFT7_9NEOP|nr:hypothetical protein PR048_015026 [Dryococelus australis]